MTEEVFNLLAEMNKKIDNINEKREKSDTQDLKGTISTGEKSPGNAAQGVERMTPGFGPDRTAIDNEPQLGKVRPLSHFNSDPPQNFK